MTVTGQLKIICRPIKKVVTYNHWTIQNGPVSHSLLRIFAKLDHMHNFTFFILIFADKHFCSQLNLAQKRKASSTEEGN